jgi:hypothetical protein
MKKLSLKQTANKGNSKLIQMKKVLVSWKLLVRNLSRKQQKWTKG